MNTPVSPLHRTPTTAPPASSATGQVAGSRSASRRRPLGRGAGGAAAALFALAVATATAGPALAHDQLLSTTPSAGSTVTTAPEELSLTFSGNLITGQGIQNVLTVTDEAGHQWQAGEAQVSGPELTSVLCEGLPNGDYDVAYRVVYSDGHSEAKEYGFTVDDPAAPDTAVPQGCGVPNPEAPASATGGAAPETPGDDAGAGTAGSASPGSGTEPAPATLDTPAPLASEQGGASDAEAASAANQDGVPGWVWVVGVLGVLLVAAAVVFVARRARAIDGPSGGRPGSEG